MALGLLLAACSHPQPASSPADAAARPLPPPERPTDVLLDAHFGQPRVTARNLLGGRARLFELGLAFQLGIPSAVISAVDLARPMDVVMAGPVESPHVVWVFTPGPLNTLRSTLAAQFRFTPVAGLGERLDPRRGDARGVARCAVVGVPGPVPVRIACARTTDALSHAARYAAYLSQQRADARDDALVEVDVATARATLIPRLQRTLTDAARRLAASAAEERRSHARPPDLGDPEALVAMLGRFARDLPAQTADVRRLTLRASVTPEQVALDTEADLDPAGRSSLARDTLARVGAGGDHPLASRLAPDSAVLLASRATPAEHAALVTGMLDAVLEVLGERVPDRAAARQDLAALVARVGDGIVLGTARDAQGGLEQTAIFALTDGGAEARAVLARLPRAAWLRGLRLGDAAVSVQARNQVLLLRLPPAPTRSEARGADAGTPAVPAPPRAVALAVVGDALVVVAGSRPEAALAAVGPRASGPSPAVLAQAPAAPLVFAADVGALRGAPVGREVVSVTYGAAREGELLVGRGRLAVPGGLVTALLGMLSQREE
jgi:hypothetical protein